jgi:nitroimidazol reductase NimA-like FMN-containing flavoprotein (pyridoxamine 5'-phosphate oxidase superfamily)
MLEVMKTFLKERDMAVLATAGESGPHTSLMAYLTDDAAENVYLVTLKNTHKYANMAANPAVSLLVDDRLEAGPGRKDQVKALTVFGRRAPLDAAQRSALLGRFRAERPQAAGLAAQADAEVVRIQVRAFLFLEDAVTAHYEEVV